jgi:hypothetical protein
MNRYEYDPEQTDSVNPEIAQRFYDTATNMAIQPGAGAPEQTPPDARWILGATAAQGAYRPVDAPWLPDVGGPAIGGGGQFSPGVPVINRAADSISKALFVRPPEDNSPSPILYRTADPRFSITQRDVDQATDKALAFSAGGLTTKPIPKAPADSSIFRNATISRGPPRGMLTADEIAVAPTATENVALPPNTYANPKLREKAEKIWNTYPQYAEKYPEVGPPALMEKRPDPNRPGRYLTTKPLGEVPYTSWEDAVAKDATPQYFFEKKLLPDAQKFADQRNIVQRDMDLHGYPKYFDPAKRADIPASDYGPFKDTRIEANPRTQETTAKFDALYGTDAARARLQAGYEKGQTLEGADRWYWMKQLQDKYVEVLGPQLGKEAFKKEFSGMMAATTGGASPYDNFLMSHWANYLNKQGKNVAQRAYEMPFPIGGRFASGNMKQAQKYIDQGMTGFNPVKNPKRYDFDNALAGDVNAGVIDEQMFGAIMPGQTIPQWYGPATNVLHQEAGKVGIGHNSQLRGVRDFQDVGWAGLKALKTEAKTGKPFVYEGPMIDQINRSIETTHRLTGMPVEEIVVRGLIKKEIPMYGIGAAAAAPVIGSLADQKEYKLSSGANYR